jgi:membrane dipeptidase
MGRNKDRGSYTSWSYLEPEVDYILPELEKQVERVPEYEFGLSKTQKERVEEIIEKNIIIDLHEHLGVMSVDGTRSFSGRQFIGYNGLAYSGADVVFFNSGGDTMEEVISWLGMALCDYAHQDFVIPALKIDDITRAYKEGKVALIHTIETASAIDKDVDKLDILYGLGIRSMGLCYSESNKLGSGDYEIRDGGLTDYGYDAVKRMNKTGIIVDVSHAGPITAMETIEASDKPICISHCGSQTLTPSTRFLPDDVLKACAEKDGVVGVNCAGSAPRTKEHPEASVECVLDHVKYLIDILGVDHVGVGPDTFWGDHAGMYRRSPKARGGMRFHARPALNRKRPESPIKNQLFTLMDLIKDLEYVPGMESPSDFNNVTKGLVRDGYSDEEIAKIIGQNALRLIKECWAK